MRKLNLVWKPLGGHLRAGAHQQEVETLDNVLARQREELAGVKALEHRACTPAASVLSPTLACSCALLAGFSCSAHRT